MIETITDFLFSWWGLIGLLILIVVELIIERTIMGNRVRDLIFLAEELGRKKVLKSGQEKFEWVKQHGYDYLPPVLHLLLTKQAYGLIVQSIFDKIMEWANKNYIQKLTV